MITAKDIQDATGLTGVTLYGDGSFTANEPITDLARDRVARWHAEGAVTVRPDYVELREAAYLAEGITPDALAVAIAEKDGEGNSAPFDALQAKRAAIKLRFPKPL